MDSIKINKKNVAAIFVMFLSILFAYRLVAIGTDTLAYISHFTRDNIFSGSILEVGWVSL